MFSNIICAIDGSELSTKALRYSVELAVKTGSRITAVTVTDTSMMLAPGSEMMMIDTTSMLADLDAAKAETAKNILAEASAIAQASGITIREMHVTNSPAAEGILHAAVEVGANLVVMGSHGRRGLGRLLLGSQASEVLAHSKVPVLVVK